MEEYEFLKTFPSLKKISKYLSNDFQNKPYSSFTIGCKSDMGILKKYLNHILYNKKLKFEINYTKSTFNPKFQLSDKSNQYLIKYEEGNFLLDFNWTFKDKFKSFINLNVDKKFDWDLIKSVKIGTNSKEYGNLSFKCAKTSKCDRKKNQEFEGFYLINNPHLDSNKKMKNHIKSKFYKYTLKYSHKLSKNTEISSLLTYGKFEINLKNSQDYDHLKTFYSNLIKFSKNDKLIEITTKNCIGASYKLFEERDNYTLESYGGILFNDMNINSLNLGFASMNRPLKFSLFLNLKEFDFINKQNPINNLISRINTNFIVIYSKKINQNDELFKKIFIKLKIFTSKKFKIYSEIDFKSIPVKFIANLGHDNFMNPSKHQLKWGIKFNILL